MNPSVFLLLAGLAAAPALAADKPAAKPSGKAAKSAGAWSVDAVNAASGQKPVGPRASGAHALRAQILLARAHFSTGEIDGSYGMNMRHAVAGYQKKNGLEASGTVDAATWDALNADSAPALITYTIQPEDVAGPFEPVPEDMAAKATMSALGFASAEEALAERFHASPALLRRLNPGKDMGVPGTEILVPNVLDVEPLPKAGRVVVDKSDSTVTLYDTAGTVVAQFPASTGSPRDPLPIGKWKIKGVAKNPVFHYNPKLFWDASPADKKERIPAGPNNPVGVAWIDLTKDHYGIHGTPEPGRIGKSQSHGCIRLTNWDVMLVSAAVAPGVEVSMEE